MCLPMEWHLSGRTFVKGFYQRMYVMVLVQGGKEGEGREDSR